MRQWWLWFSLFVFSMVFVRSGLAHSFAKEGVVKESSKNSSSVSPNFLPKDLYSTSLDREAFLEKPGWAAFQALMVREKETQDLEGMAYLVSGGVAFVGSIVGYHNSKDIFAKGIFALGQSLGVAAIGYGAYQRSLGSEYRTLFETLQRQASLSNQERDQFVKLYFQLEKERSRQSERIAAMTHGLLAGLNVYNASLTKQEELRSALYFVAAINLLASVSYSF